MTPCDWHRLWPPEGVVKCDREGTHDMAGYGGSPVVWFCCEHYQRVVSDPVAVHRRWTEREERT